MKEAGPYARLFERVGPGLRVGLVTYLFGILAYYGVGCLTGMNARFGRSVGDTSDDLWTLNHCAYAAGITFTTIGYTDELGTDDVRIYRHVGTGHLYAYNSHDGLVPEPGAPRLELGDPALVVERDFSVITTMTTVLLALVGMGVFVYSISAVTAFFVEGGHLELQERRKVQRRIASLEGHVIIAGAGPTGLHAAERLRTEGIPLVVVDREADALQHLRGRFPGILWIEGDATDPESLRSAGLGRARGFLAAMTRDNDNLVALVTARQENPALRILSRAESQDSAGRLRRAGAHEAIAASYFGGMRIASEAIRPTVVRFLDGFLGHEEEKAGFHFAGIRVDAGSPRAGRTLGECRFLEETGLRVLALRYAGRRDFRYNPGPDAVLEPNCEVAVVADAAGMDRARAFLGARGGAA